MNEPVFDPAPAPVAPATMEMIELLFFAYRDFVSDPDEILLAYGFGRAHHRVLHFVSRNPGITVSDLLDILAITKQSLARVLKQLVDGGFISQQQGVDDRRHRLLRVTETGARLAARLSQPQARRIEQALATLGPDAAASAASFLAMMCNPETFDKITAKPNRPKDALRNAV